MRKKALEKRLNRLIAKRDALKARALESEDVKEVRSINAELEDIVMDIDEIREEIDAIDAEARAAEIKSAAPVNAEIVNAFKTNATTARAEDTDPYSTVEYRRAFMAYAQRGTPIPAELCKRDDMAANTTSLGATVPTTVLNEFINEIRKRYGNLYNKVRKLNIQGAVKVPIAQLQATFK